MQTEAAEQGALFVPETPRYGQGELEKAVRASIEEIKAGAGIKPARLFLAHTAIELAKSIDKGNAKGRAVANEAAQLVSTMELLDPTVEAGADPDQLPPDLREFLNAFSSSPRKPDLPTDGEAPLPRPGDPTASNAA